MLVVTLPYTLSVKKYMLTNEQKEKRLLEIIAQKIGKLLGFPANLC